MMTVRRLIISLVTLAVAACTQMQEGPSVLPPGGESPTEPSQHSQPTTKPVKKPTTQKPAISDTPARPDRPFVPEKPGHRVARVNVPGKYVALTFDDGPSSAYTPQVLDILRRNGARATFFVLGQNAARNKSLLARAVAEGHEIANHTYSHIKMTTAGSQTVAREIERTNEIIKSATGYYPTTMRPPYGSINSSLVDKMYNNYGMHAVLWDVDTRDWQHPGVSTVVRRAVGNAQSGSIILLHDIHASTLSAVEDIVTGLQARGFKLVTVSQLIEIGRRAAGESSTAPAPLQPEVAPSPSTGAGAGEAVIGTVTPVAEEAAGEAPAAEEPAGESPVAVTEPESTL